MDIKNIFESDEVLYYLEKRNLIKQYKKAKNFVLLWFYENVSLKKREPKNENIYYFRINKQFRAIWYIENSNLYILEIDNHQK